MSRIDPRPAGAHRWLLRAALLDGEAALAAWRSWRASVDLDRLDQASFRLAPLLWRNLERLRVDDPWMETLHGIHRRTWVENQILLRRLAGAVRLLSRAGIPSIVLKGAALVSQAYRDTGARSMADVDLLVPSERFGPALASLRSAGWVAEPERAALFDRSPAAFRAEHVALGLRQEGDPLDVLDLHAQPLRVYMHHPVPFPEARLFGAAESFDLHGVPARRLAPGHQLLHVCFHGMQAQHVPSIRWVADAQRLLVATGDRLDWGLLLREARAHRVLAPLREALILLAAEYAGPVPPAVLRALRRVRLSTVERFERPLRLGHPGALADYGRVLAPIARRVRVRARLEPACPRELLALANRLLVRLPWKHGVSGPGARTRARHGIDRAPG